MALLSGIYCVDETLDSNDLNLDDFQHPVRDSTQSSKLDAAQFILSDVDFAWHDAELRLLMSKEEELVMRMDFDLVFVEVRREAVDWMIRVCSKFGFSEVCVVLGVCYFDRFWSGVGVNRWKPWIGQLTAVACLSLAAKMEEVAVPLLVDLQVEGVKYIFEAKTVQRMELLVLSALKWKMNPVTPFSFLDHFIRRFGSNKVHLRLLKMCGSLLVSVTADIRSLRYRPSMLAVATMLYVVQEVEPIGSFGYQEQLVDVLKLCKEKLDECYSLVCELSMELNPLGKCDSSAPNSPHGVIDMSFSCASSTVSSSLEPPSKRRRIQEQQLHL